MSKNTLNKRYLDALEIRTIKGATQVWFWGHASQGLKVYEGGPSDAFLFRKVFAEILQDNVNEWTDVALAKAGIKH